MMNWPAAVLFDLDGTLVDSVPDMANAVDLTMAKLGFAKPGVDVVRNWVGDGVGVLLERALLNATGSTPEHEVKQQAMNEFLRAYADRLCVDSTLYPGVAELLGTLSRADVPLGVVTNKPAAFTEPLLAELGIADFFGVSVSGDTLEQRKPHPLPVHHACKVLGAPDGESVLVGDSPNDAIAAKAAGLGAILMTWGYNTGVDLNTLNADAVLDSADALQTMLSEWSLR